MGGKIPKGEVETPGQQMHPVPTGSREAARTDVQVDDWRSAEPTRTGEDTATKKRKLE